MIIATNSKLSLSVYHAFFPADGGICTDPDVFLQRNGRRGANTVAALLRVDGMTGAGKAYAGGNKGTCADVYRRGIQNDTVIVDDRQAVGMDVEAIDFRGNALSNTNVLNSVQ